MPHESLRPATAADVPAIAAVVDAAFSHYISRIGRPPEPMTADYRQVIAAGHTFVAVTADEIVGVLVLTAAADHLSIDTIAVVPEAQGGGVGARLLERAELETRRLALCELRLSTNEAMTENLAYYPRRGYREIGRGVEDGFSRVFFTKLLKS